jgi:hypothetical protein
MSDRHELLLEWVSERGDGSWHDFRQGHDWLFPEEGLAQRQRRPGVTALVLASLGHMEMDWEHGRWSAAPAMLTVLPNAGGHALLTGGRTRTLIRRLRELLDSMASLDVILEVRAQDEAPDAYFLPAGSEADIAFLARELGIAYEYCVADRISSLLPALDSVLANAKDSPPAEGFEMKQLRTGEGDLSWVTSDSVRRPGLYGFDVWGREVYRWADGAGRFLALDKFTGVYAELHRQRMNVISLRIDGPTGTLSVPATAPLPALHARAAVLCSGVAPEYSRAEHTRQYVNVPRQIALRIAASLGQDLEVIESASQKPLKSERKPPPHIRFTSRADRRPGRTPPSPGGA